MCHRATSTTIRTRGLVLPTWPTGQTTKYNFAEQAPYKRQPVKQKSD